MASSLNVDYLYDVYQPPTDLGKDQAPSHVAVHETWMYACIAS